MEQAVALAHAIRPAPVRERWADWGSHVGRWHRRNGLSLPRPGLPGIVHQGWGWYDGLPSALAAVVTMGAILFVAATTMYLASANAALHELATAAPAVPRLAAVATSAPVAAPVPTLAPAPSGGTVARSVITLPPSLRLREQASTSASMLRDLPAGTRLEVLDGTATANGFQWVQVRAPDGTIGWVIEDAIDSY